MKPWIQTIKSDVRCRRLVDRHYTRQSPGNPKWTRPGYNAVLYAVSEMSEACWCWWRPKWEDGRPGTGRKDGLHVLECTMFRREGSPWYIEGALPRSSDLIRAACGALSDDQVISALHLHEVQIDGLITGVFIEKTAAGRSPRSEPGACYLAAGWKKFDKRSGKADLWLWYDV